MIKLLVAASLIGLVYAFPQGVYERYDEAGKCGYDSCPVPIPGKINVHLVPHTHDDVGWLKTVDQYYFGSKTYIQNAGVQYIIDSVINELQHDPKKKFIYVETAFFWKWWKEQDDHTKHTVKRLVNNGQLEFIGGAWSMNDEATTHYQSTIDQFTWGLRKLNDTFGQCGRPKIGWQIDPFGHSKEMASMMAHFGFDGLFFGRLDYQDKNKRMSSHTMEMIWEGSSTLGKAGDLMTGALYNHYSAPPGFCFDVLCNDEPFITDRRSSDYNVDEKVEEFIRFVERQSKRFITSNIILTMGDDFHFQDAHKYYKNLDALISGDIFTGALFNLYQAPRGFCFDIMCGDEPIIDDEHSPDYNVNRRVKQFLDFIVWQSVNYKTDEILLTMGGDFNYQDAHYYFKNLEKLIRYVNELQKTGSNVNVFYSTPSCYVKSLNDANVTWPTKQDDFFPYASDPHAYWTGYFTSRPTQKYYERQGNNFLQICKQLSSLAHLGPEDNPDIDDLREAMGIMQHHDAITGTEKQHVANDYSRILTEAIRSCGKVASTGLNKIMTKGNPNVPALEFKSCPLANISECSTSQNSAKFIATIYNPLSRPATYYVRLPVSGKRYSVKDPKGVEIENQIVPVPSSLHGMPGRTATSSLELVFKATALPPLGYRSYYISLLNANEQNPEFENLDGQNEYVLGDDALTLTMDPSTGLLSSVSYGGNSLSFNQTLEYYIGQSGNNKVFENRSSGAYIFRPKGESTYKIADKVNSTMYKGSIVTEYHQVFSPWASQVIRKYAGEYYAEVEWLVGPIPVHDGRGKEIVSKYSTDLKSDGLFYTDSNGRQTLERKRNFRPTWDLELHEPVSGNYYPITTDISVNDRQTEMTVLIDRAQGGSSLKDGEIELMLHRRLLYDDGFGVDEALNEEAYGKGLIARGRHWIIMGNLSNPNWPKQKRLLQQEKVLSPQVVLTNAENLNFDVWQKNYKTEFSGLNQALPPTVHILTLEPWKGKTYLLRLEHLFDEKESKTEVTVDLSNMFSAFEIVSVRETSLAADRWLDEVSRLKWRKESNEVIDEKNPTESMDTAFPQVTLKPKQIRTFVCDIKAKSLY